MPNRRREIFLSSLIQHTRATVLGRTTENYGSILSKAVPKHFAEPQAGLSLDKDAEKSIEAIKSFGFIEDTNDRNRYFRGVDLGIKHFLYCK